MSKETKQENQEETFDDINFDVENLSPDAGKGNEPPKDGPSEENPEDIARAAEMGHISFDKFKGDPKNYIDAKTFIERGEKLMPILKANNRKMEAQNKELKDTVDGLKTGFDEYKAYHKETIERAKKASYEKAMKDFKAQQREAAENGDIAEFDRLEGEKETLTQEYSKSDETPQKPKEEPSDNSEFVPSEAQKEFMDANEWFGKDDAESQAMTAFANSKETELAQKNGWDHNSKELYAAVQDAVRTNPVFAHKFENQRRNGDNQVEAPNRTVTTPTTKKTFADLPPDAQAQCRRLQSEKYGAAVTEEEYIKHYFNDDNVIYFDN